MRTFLKNVDGQGTQAIIKNLNLKKSEVLKSKFYWSEWLYNLD